MFSDFESAERECIELATEMGENWSEALWWKLRRVSLFWKRAERQLDVIERKKQREALKAKINAAAKARKAQVRARRARSKQRSAIQKGAVQRDAVYAERLKDVENLTKGVNIQEKVQLMSNIFQYQGN